MTGCCVEASVPPNRLSELSRAVFYANRLLLEAASTLTAPLGLNAAAWQVLGIVEHGPEPVSNLARLWSLTRQGVQQTTDKMARDGLVEYRPNPHHRRAKLVCITPEGVRALAQIRAGQAVWAEPILAGLPPDMLETTLATLHTLAGLLEAHPAAPQPQETP